MCVLLFVSLLAIVHWEFIWISFSLIFISFCFAFFVCPCQKFGQFVTLIEFPCQGWAKSAQQKVNGAKNTAIYVSGQWVEGSLVKKSQKAQNILHKFAYNCLNLAWCEGWAGHMQNMPHISHTQHMQQQQQQQRQHQHLLPQLRTSGKFTLLRQCGVVCAACLRGVRRMLTISCAENVFLYLHSSLTSQHSTRPCPALYAHFLCHLKSHWCAIRVANAVVRRTLQAAFPSPASGSASAACHT